MNEPNCGLSLPGRMQATGNVLDCEDILVRTLANAPPNDDVLHGRAQAQNRRTCIRCGCAFDAPGPRRFADDDFCLLCLEEIARADERAAALDERCRVHRVRRVEDLPVSVLEEMQRGRC